MINEEAAMQEAVQLLISFGFDCADRIVVLGSPEEAQAALLQIQDILNEHGLQAWLETTSTTIAIFVVSRCKPGEGNMEVEEAIF